MTFISYAQNFEDVMLWRALGTVEEGFWIDVGAAHPTEFSVTRAFCDRRWRGINIEPEPDYAAALRAERPRDVNLEVAIGAVPGRAMLQRIVGTGLSTFDRKIAADHAAAGFPSAEPMEVEVTTLAAVCGTYAPQDIHFLKIDAEGAEREVLLGADLMTYRPWIIVAEATIPGSPVARIDAFEDVLNAADYRQCWFDGLNAFFVAAEHEARLARFFRTPPNVFDDFVRADQVTAIVRAEAAERRVSELDAAWHEAQASLASQRGRVTELEANLDRLTAVLQCQEAQLRDQESELQDREEKLRRQEKETHRLSADVSRMEEQLIAIQCSTSWRLTGPLRAAARLLAKR